MSASSILGSKGISLLVMFFSVPLTYNYLGEERFGLLMLVLSMVMLMSFADLGLGYGLLNKIARYDNAKDHLSLKKAVSSTFFFLAATGIFLFGIFIILYSRISWSEVLNVKSTIAQAEAGKAVFVFACCFCLTLPFTIITRLQAGYQENHMNQIWEGGGNLLSLIALFIVVKLKSGVPLILLALYGSQCLFVLLNFGFHFLFKRKHLWPSFYAWDTAIFKDIFKESIMICSLQVSSILINAIDSILIARYVGPIAVGAYAIGYRLFSIFILPVQAFLSSFLPAFNDAVEGRDVHWIMRGARKSILGVIVFSSLLSIVFILLANPIITIWISRDVRLSWPLLIAFGVYIIYQNISSLIFTVMLSPIFLKKLFVLFNVTAIVVISLKILFIGTFHYSSVIWATIIGATLLFLIPGYTTVYKALKRMHKAVVL